jgi:hypothetical protein
MLHLPPSDSTVPRRMLGLKPEPEFVNVYGAQESIPPAYVAWRAGTSNRFVVLVLDRQAGNRFRSFKGLQIRAQECCDCGIDSQKHYHSAKAHPQTQLYLIHITRLDSYIIKHLITNQMGPWHRRIRGYGSESVLKKRHRFGTLKRQDIKYKKHEKIIWPVCYIKIR